MPLYLCTHKYGTGEPCTETLGLAGIVEGQAKWELVASTGHESLQCLMKSQHINNTTGTTVAIQGCDKRAGQVEDPLPY